VVLKTFPSTGVKTVHGRVVENLMKLEDQAYLKALPRYVEKFAISITDHFLCVFAENSGMESGMVIVM